MGFPFHRLRRMRTSEPLRRLVRQTRLAPDDFILPLFVRDGEGLSREIPSMPGQFQYSPDRLLVQAQAARELGICAVILFGIPRHKDDTGSESLSEEGIVQRTLRLLKREVPEVLVITDVCLCEYTDHGHCGVVERAGERYVVDNDRTLELLAEQACSHARAGADMVAPSAMMDGQVQAIRSALDAHGRTDVGILAYAAKFASCFYGPFRDAAESPPQFGDRRSYQMDPANADEAMREIALDIEEGADIVMVKPALAYLDIVRRARQEFNYPLAAYNVSGEYAMIKAAAACGWLDEKKAVIETLCSIKRAGADMVLTYFALDAARWLREGQS